MPMICSPGRLFSSALTLDQFGFLSFSVTLFAMVFAGSPPVAAVSNSGTNCLNSSSGNWRAN